MNIIEFWKKEVSTRNHYSQYDREEFLKKLEENVPDWREQVKDKNIWPDLHMQGSNINETVYLDVILEEAGLEYAYFLIENKKFSSHIDAHCALHYCRKRISTDWNNFPEIVKDEILQYCSRDFSMECYNNLSLWNSLTVKRGPHE